MDIIKFKMGALEKGCGYQVIVVWLVVLKICLEKLATLPWDGQMTLCRAFQIRSTPEIVLSSKQN